MPAPELFFQFGMVHEQPSGRIALEDLDQIGRTKFLFSLDTMVCILIHMRQNPVQ